MRSLKSTLYGLALAALMANSAEAGKYEDSGLTIRDATYADGRVLIKGVAESGVTGVTIKGTPFSTTPNGEGRFVFSVPIALPSCHLNLVTSTGALGIIFRECAAPPYGGSIIRQTTCRDREDYFTQDEFHHVCVAACVKGEVGVFAQYTTRLKSNDAIFDGQTVHPRLSPSQRYIQNAYIAHSVGMNPTNLSSMYSVVRIFCSSDVVQ